MTLLTPSHSPIRLTSMTLRNSARLMSAIFLFSRMPALLTRTFSGPNVVRRRSHRRRPVVLAGHVLVDVAAVVLAQLIRQRLALVVQQVTEHDLRALGDEVPRVRLAHAPRAARDQRDLPVQTAHPQPLRPHRQPLPRSAVSVPNACLVRVTGAGCGGQIPARRPGAGQLWHDSGHDVNRLERLRTGPSRPGRGRARPDVSVRRGTRLPVHGPAGRRTAAASVLPDDHRRTARRAHHPVAQAG